MTKSHFLGTSDFWDLNNILRVYFSLSSCCCWLKTNCLFFLLLLKKKLAWKDWGVKGYEKNKREVGIIYLFYKLLSSVLMHLFCWRDCTKMMNLNFYEKGFTYILWSDHLKHISFWGRYSDCVHRHPQSWVSCLWTVISFILTLYPHWVTDFLWFLPDLCSETRMGLFCRGLLFHFSIRPIQREEHCIKIRTLVLQIKTVIVKFHYKRRI